MEFTFKAASRRLSDALSPKMMDGPMNIVEFWRIVREMNMEDNHHGILFAIIKLGEPALAKQYMKSVPDIKQVLNTSVPTNDRWLIHRAVWEGSLPLIEAFIDAGVSSDRLNTYNESPFAVVDAAVKQNVYGEDQADKIKALLRRADTAPPPPPPRPGQVSGTMPAPVHLPPTTQMPNMMAYANMGMGAMPAIQPAMLGAAAQLAQQMIPWMTNVMPTEVKEDLTWITVKPSPDQSHCFVSDIAFEATETDVRAAFETCGEIEKFHMPKKNLAKKSESFNHIATKLQQNLCHQGRAIIKFKDKSVLASALLMTGEPIKGRQITVTRSLKTTKKRKKAERQQDQTETEQLLGQYNKKRKMRELREKPAKGDTSWLEKLVNGPDQMHCFVSGIAFEASMSEIKKLFKKCGEVVAFYMASSGDAEKETKQYDSVRDKLARKTTHRGKAVVLYRSVFGLRAALNLTGTKVKGRELLVTRSRKTAKQTKKAKEKRAAKQKQKADAAEEEDRVMPADIDMITRAGVQTNELDQAEQAQAWTAQVMKQVNSKLARKKVSVKKKRKIAPGTMPATPIKPKEDDFMAMILEHKRQRAAKRLKTAPTAGNIGPSAKPEVAKDTKDTAAAGAADPAAAKSGEAPAVVASDTPGAES